GDSGECDGAVAADGAGLHPRAGVRRARPGDDCRLAGGDGRAGYSGLAEYRPAHRMDHGADSRWAAVGRAVDYAGSITARAVRVGYYVLEELDRVLLQALAAGAAGGAVHDSVRRAGDRGGESRFEPRSVLTDGYIAKSVPQLHDRT